MGKHIAERLADTRAFIERSRQFTARSQEFVKRLEKTLMDSKTKMEIAALQEEMDRVCAEYKKVAGSGAEKAIPLLDKLIAVATRMRKLRSGK